MRKSIIISTLLGSSLAAPRPSSSAPSNATTLADCLGQKDVPVKMIQDSDWDSYVTTYNARLQYTPTIVILPTVVQHVQDAVVCAGQFNVKVQAKSGGHSYASFSTGGMNGIMMIDMEQFQNVLVNSENVATVGAGLRLGNLALALYKDAKRTLPQGTCAGVGVGGHSTHGGYGYDSRKWGLMMDTIVALDVVLANGTYIHANSTSNSEIYWGLRGAADALGIVVSFYFQTLPAPDSVINFSYSFPDMYSDTSKGVNAFLHFQDFAQNASVTTPDIGFGVYLDGSGLSISGQYFGSLDDFNTNIAPELLRTLPDPSSSSAKSLDWISSLTALSGESTLETPVHGYDLRDNFFAKSVTIPETEPLTEAGLTSFFDYIRSSGISNAPVSWYTIANIYGGVGSAINTKTLDFAAYSDRNSLWVFQNYGFVSLDSTFPEDGLTFIDGLNNALTSVQPDTGAYLNYIDPSLTKQQAYNLYYGQPLISRLEALKAAIDPNDVFSNPLAI